MFINVCTKFVLDLKIYDAVVDSDNKIVTTAAFMCDTAVHEVFDGVGAMIDKVLKLA